MSDWFALDPITTSNLISIVQLIVVFGGFWISIKNLKSVKVNLSNAKESLNNNLQNNQVQLTNQVLAQGRELQFKFAEVFIPDGENEEKQEHFIRMLISYYASSFELQQILPLPENYNKLFKADIRASMKNETVSKIWGQVKLNYSKEFNSFINNELPV